MVHTFESLQCDGKERFEWDKYEAAVFDLNQRQLIISKYETPVALTPPFEIMVTGASGQEQMTVTSIEIISAGKARLNVFRGSSNIDFRFTNNSSRYMCIVGSLSANLMCNGVLARFACSEELFPRFAPDAWTCDPSKYWNEDGW